jgi:hypothetical protein
VNEDPECPHCRHFESDEWDGVFPSQFGGFVRPCGRHKEPRFPKIKARPETVFALLEEQLVKFKMVIFDWQALEDQL